MSELIEIIKEGVLKKGLIASRPQHAYPSAASCDYNGYIIGGCQRNEFFRHKNIPRTNPASMQGLLKMEFGNLAEDMIIDKVKSARRFIDEQTTMWVPELNLSGKLDFVYEDNNGLPVGVEVKSFYGYYAEREIFGNTQVKPYPKLDQLLQAFIYAWSFRKQLKRYKMLYMTRSNCQFQEFDIGYEVKDKTVYPTVALAGGLPVTNYGISLRDVVNRYQELNQYIKEDIIPPRDYKLYYNDDEIEEFYANAPKGSGWDVSKTNYEAFKKARKNKELKRMGHWRCNYCDYKDLCWEEALTDQGFDWATYKNPTEGLKNPGSNEPDFTFIQQASTG